MILKDNKKIINNFKLIMINFRTDNAIKNHFYSKLRKFIRKILKLINKDNLLKNNGIDVNKYNSDKVYKIIKKFKIPYNTLTKDSILNLITNFDKNSKNGKLDNNNNFLLKHKTTRKKTLKDKENLYSEKINKRKSLAFKGRTFKKEALIKKEMQECSDSDKDIINEVNIQNNNDLYSVKINKKVRPLKKLSRKSKLFFYNLNFKFYKSYNFSIIFFIFFIFFIFLIFRFFITKFSCGKFKNIKF